MDVKAHFKSVTREFEALRDRVRNFSVDAPHWLTDGEWKESVLRSVLKGRLPAHIEPLRGFAVSPGRGTRQLDILLYDNRQPVLFRNGDLVFVTPDAVSGIVEVKTAIEDCGDLQRALQSLAYNAEVIRSAKRPGEQFFVGLFSYTTGIDATRWQSVLRELQVTARGQRHRIVSHVCLGCAQFGKFWESSPDNPEQTRYDRWHYYTLTDMAAGYFISNVVAAVAGDSVIHNETLWFPEESKELRRLGTEAFRLHPSPSGSPQPAQSTSSGEQ